MIILCDCDGVLGQFVQFLISKMNKIFPEGLDGPFPLCDEITEYDLFKFFKNEKQLNVVYSILNSESFWKDMPTMPGAEAGIASLRTKNHKVVFLTKPWEGCRAWAQVRTEWIRAHFGADTKDIIITSAKEYVEGDIMIDDNPSFLKSWSNLRKKTKAEQIIFDCPYNQEYSNATRIKTWQELEKYIDNFQKQ